MKRKPCGCKSERIYMVDFVTGKKMFFGMDKEYCKKHDIIVPMPNFSEVKKTKKVKIKPKKWWQFWRKK